MAGQPMEAQEAAALGVNLADGASQRERQHAAIIADVVGGRRDPALARIREHIEDYPRDALAIDPAAGVFGLIGFSGRQDREAEQLALLEPLAPYYEGDWWYQRVFGFALLEHDAVERAIPLLEAAVDARPDSGHVAHTWVHALFEADEHEQALNWLTDWLPSYEAGGLMFCHLWWHLALFHLLNRNFEAMWQAYDDHCLEDQSSSPAINLFTDGVALAWALGEKHFPKPGIFVDVHRAACLALLEDSVALEEFRAICRGKQEKGRLAAGEVVLNIADGFEAYANGDWSRARDCFTEAMPAVVRIGGSRAQRRIVSETLVAAEANL
jgi:tetratricopeptide (TPR) repeat protein